MDDNMDYGQAGSTNRRLYRVDRKAVCFIKFIFEAYDGIALLETIDPHTACIALHVAPGCEPDVDALITDLGREHLIEPVAPSRHSEPAFRAARGKNEAPGRKR